MQHVKTNGFRSEHLTGATSVLSAMANIALATALVFLLSSNLVLASTSTTSVLPSGIEPLDKGRSNSLQATEALKFSMFPGTTPQSLIVELVNQGDSILHLLRDGTPFDDVPGGDALQVMLAGKRGINQPVIPYIGPVYSRMPPDATRFMAIAPEQTIRVEIDVAANYMISSNGVYRIKYVGAFEIAENVSLQANLKLQDVATTWVPEVDSIELSLPVAAPVFEPRAQQPQFDGCSSGQQSLIVDATLLGETIASESMQSLRETPLESRSTSPRYTTWFGRYSESNYSTVTSVYDRISSALTNEAIAYRCEPEFCTSRSSVIAYVQPFLSELVNLCALFFNEPRLSDEDRAGTVVHELSHLLRLGATDDLSYGASGTFAVAQSSANDAVNNAEAYTLFATNNQPALPMIDDGTGGGQVAAVPDEVGTDPAAGFIPLMGGFTARGEIGEDSIEVFRVSESMALELTSLTGDADLYVFSDISLASETLVCSSIEFSRDSTLDTCQIVGEAEAYAVVHGFTRSSFELVAVRRSNDDTAIVEGATELSVGEIATGVLSQNDAAVYSAIMPGSIVLTSLSGDVDLFVFSSAAISTDTLVCNSRLETPQDVCDLPGTGRVHIGLLGIGAENSYELAIRSLGSDPPPEDDPSSLPNLNASSGGGISGFATLVMLIGLVLLKLRLFEISVSVRSK